MSKGGNYMYTLPNILQWIKGSSTDLFESRGGGTNHQNLITASFLCLLTLLIIFGPFFFSTFYLVRWSNPSLSQKG